MADTHPAEDCELLPDDTDAPVRRVLVVANQTATSSTLLTELLRRSTLGDVQFHLVVPALNTRLRHWLSDTDDAVSAARLQGDEALAALEAALESQRVAVSMEIGDTVPLLAIEDALSLFDADEIVISTLPPERSHWLEHNLVDDARSRFDVPVTHVVADPQVAQSGPRRGLTQPLGGAAH
jgi:GABA permease